MKCPWTGGIAVALIVASTLCIVADVPIAAAAPAGDECESWQIFGCISDQGGLQEESNANFYLLKAVTPCNDAVLAFYPAASHKVFRWSVNANPEPYGIPNPANVQALLPDKVRLEFKSGSIDLHHGVPGFYMPDVSSDEGQASFDLMKLQERGETDWLWRLTDHEGDAKVGIAPWGENERDIMVSDWCDFKIDFDALAGQPDDQSKDQSTGAFASPGYLTPLSPCGGAAVWYDISHPTEPFTYSIGGANIQVMEFLEAGSDTWKQYPKVISGVLPPDTAAVNLQELMKAEDEDDWQWRITAGTVHSNACAFKIKEGISTTGSSSSSSAPSPQSPAPPPPAGGPPAGFSERATYAGNCTQRPAGTVCVSFPDGYVWLVNDSILKNEDRGTVDGKSLRVAVGAKAEYQHLLNTNYVRQVNK